MLTFYLQQIWPVFRGRFFTRLTSSLFKKFYAIHTLPTASGFDMG